MGYVPYDEENNNSNNVSLLFADITTQFHTAQISNASAPPRSTELQGASIADTLELGVGVFLVAIALPTLLVGLLVRSRRTAGEKASTFNRRRPLFQ